MDDLKKVNNLKLYEEINIKDFFVLRVPGGFIYSRSIHLDKEEEENPEFSCFVPLSNEFKEVPKQKIKRVN